MNTLGNSRNIDEKLKFYNLVFSEENNISMVRKWLIKSKVNKDDIDDMESELVVIYTKCAMKHNYDKIPFDRYVWTQFKNRLIDYFRSNTRKRAKEFIPIEENTCIVNIPDDFAADYDVILNFLGDTRAFIFDSMYRKGWKYKEICNHLGMTRKEFLIESRQIRKQIKQYSTHQL